MRDFEKDGQRYVFDGLVRKDGQSFMRFTSECAICAKPIQFDVVSYERATAAPSRRCDWHKLPAAPVGSRAEAIAIASNGWRVAVGSVLDTKRRAGLAWTAIVTTFEPTGVATRPRKKKRDLPKNEIAMAARIYAEGPLTAPQAAKFTTMTNATARTYATRLVARGLLKRISWGVFDLTEEGRNLFSPLAAAQPSSDAPPAQADIHTVIGLFD